MKQLREGVPGNLPLVPLSTDSSKTTVAVTNYANNIAAAVWSGMASASTIVSGSAGPTDLSLSSQSAPPPPTPAPGKVSPEAIFFCRKVYDYRQKRMLKNPS
jgi:hypothetical protein